MPEPETVVPDYERPKRKPLSEEHRRKLSEAAKAAHEKRRKSPPPESDAAPKTRRGRTTKAERRSGELRLIEAGLRELFVDTPALAGAMTKDPWLVDHATSQGPPLVQRLTAEAERSERFRALLLGLVKGQSWIMLAVVVGMYGAPIAMHYGLAPNALGVPEKRPKRAPATSQAPFQQPPPPQPADNGASENEAASETEVRSGEAEIPSEPPPVEPV